MTTANYSLKSMSNFVPPGVDAGYYASLDEHYAAGRSRQTFIQALEHIGPSPCDDCPYRQECAQGKACADFYAFILENEEGGKMGRVLYRLSKEAGGRVPLAEIYDSIFDKKRKFYRSSKASIEMIAAMAVHYPRPGE